MIKIHTDPVELVIITGIFGILIMTLPIAFGSIEDYNDDEVYQVEIIDFDVSLNN